MDNLSQEFFRDLDPEEEKEMKKWARENYTRMSPIKGVWHPAVQQECAKMNAEVKMELKGLIDDFINQPGKN
jgi:hypothetical protein